MTNQSTLGRTTNHPESRFCDRWSSGGRCCQRRSRFHRAATRYYAAEPARTDFHRSAQRDAASPAAVAVPRHHGCCAALEPHHRQLRSAGKLGRQPRSALEAGSGRHRRAGGARGARGQVGELLLVEDLDRRQVGAGDFLRLTQLAVEYKLGRREIETLGKKVDWKWVMQATRGLDTLEGGLRRNIGRQLGLDALITSLSVR